jgi:PKD repeat protein/subtilisin-like proprotein convertase family protein
MLLSAQSYLISQGGTITTCSGTLYDSGGSGGQYSNYEDYTITICSSTGGHIELYFSVFDVESASFDHLTIYDGPNTGSPLLVPSTGSQGLLNQTFESAGSCLTLVWHTDGSVTYAGFAAEISCGYPCQDFTVDLISPTLPTPPDSIIYACPGIGVEFIGQGSYPNNNQNYSQSDASLTWTWTVTTIDAVQFSGLGMSTLPYDFNISGASFVTFEATDINGCTYVYPESQLVYVSVPPTFTGTVADQTEICSGDEVNYTGFVQVEPWVVVIPTIVNECYCADDEHHSEPQCAEFVHSAFAPGQTITSINDIEALCMQLEHSYIGDLDMWITCPNGQSVDLLSYPNGCGSTYFGQPIDNDSNPCTTAAGIGVLYDYCWTPGATQTISSACSSNSTIPPGNYLPEGNFSGLIGCPINGTWQICFRDNLYSDDGTVCNFELQFAESVLPSEDSIWSFENTYNPDLFEWTGDGMETNSGGTAIAHPSTSGDQVFTFSATDDFGCTFDTTVIVHVLSANDPSCCTQPYPVAGDDISLCQNTYTLNGETTAGNTVNWSMVSGPGNAAWQNQNSPNATVTVDAWGIYVFEIYEENLGPACSATDQVQVQFWPVPNATFNYVSADCYGDVVQVNYIGNATAAATYTWGFGNATVMGGSGSGPYQLVWNDAGSQEVTLQVSENGCQSNDTSVTINYPEELTYTLTVSDDPCFQSCNGQAVLQVNGGTLPYEYHWGSPTNILSHLCVGDYGVSVTDANECEISATYSIAQPTELVITDTTYTTISCFGASDGTMGITVEGGTGDYMYLWSDIGPAGSMRNNVDAGNYYVSVVDEHDCQVVEFFQITQPDELQVVISSDIAICEGQTLSVTAQQMGGTPPYIYYWNDGSGFVQDAPSLSVTPDTTTTYTVYVEDIHGCVSNYASMTITVSPALSIDDVLLEDNSCYHSCDGRAELLITGGIPPLQYSWASGNHIYNHLCEGLYQVTVTDAIGCQAHTHFFINEPDSITHIMVTENANCFGSSDGSANITVAGGTLPYQYLWPNGETGVTMTNSAGTYEVTVTDAHNCRLEAWATINQPAQLYIHPFNDRQICIGQTTSIGAQVTGGTPYYDFFWQGSDGTSYNSHMLEVSPIETTTYDVTVTDGHGCTSNVQDVTVNVYPGLEITAIVTSYDTVCVGDAAIIQVDVEGGNGGPYQLFLEEGQIVPSPFSVYPNETTTYLVTAYDNCGTPGVTDSITIIAMPQPPNVFVADKIEACPPGVIHFSEQSPDLGQHYLWNFGDNGFANIKNPTHIYRNEGTYDVSLIVRSEYGCENERTFIDMITIYPQPYANFMMEPENSTMLEPEIEFINLSEDALYSFWFFGDGDSSLFTNPRHQYVAMGEYQVMLIIESEHGCTDTVFRSLNIESINTFYAPETFTPIALECVEQELIQIISGLLFTIVGVIECTILKILV